jgi:hypothetical protein
MHRIRPDGCWQRILPGVVLMHTGTPTTRERLLGCLAYAGEDAVITGAAALRLYGLRTAPPDGQVQVLVPHDRLGSHTVQHWWSVPAACRPVRMSSGCEAYR